MTPEKRTDFTHDVEVFDFSTLFGPAVTLPGQRPFSNDIDPEFAVGIDLARLAISMFERRHDRESFHADVGRFAAARLASEHYRYIIKNNRKSARPGVRAGTAISIVRRHAYHHSKQLAHFGLVIICLHWDNSR